MPFIRFLKNKTRNDFFPHLNGNVVKQIRGLDSTFAINYRCFDARLLQNRVILVSTADIKTSSIRWFLLLVFMCFIVVGFSLTMLVVAEIYPVTQLMLANVWLKLVQDFFTSAYVCNYLEFCSNFFIIKWLLASFQDFFTQIYLSFTFVVYFLAYA